MSRTTARIAAAIGPVVPAVLVAVPAFGWVWEANARASWSSLGRDQDIFQYIVWAAGRGEIAYRDIRDVNGEVLAKTPNRLRAEYFAEFRTARGATTKDTGI